VILSPAVRLASLSAEERRTALAGMSAKELEALPYVWPFWARPDQLPPHGDWRTWLLMGGRGSGKTRSSSEWVRGEIESGRRRNVGIIGPTADAVRKIQVEGISGILATAPPDARLSYEPSTRRIVWPNGAIAHLFSAEEPERLRGPNLDGAWFDEIVASPNAAAVWDMLQFALRIPGPLGDAPRVIVSTTPKPIPILRSIIKASDTVITRAATLDNAANLDPSTLRYYVNKYGGTSLGRQELDGELVEDLEGALWNRAMIEACRVERAPGDWTRVVVAVDPSGGSKATSDEVGIIVAAVAHDKDAYILKDHSGRYTPEQWARVAVDAYEDFQADRIVAEANYGGAMVEATIRAVKPNVPVKLVNASRGKAVRAEPVVALYEQGRVHHLRSLTTLEDQLCGWAPGMSGSPDRLDALVWAITELMLGNKTTYDLAALVGPMEDLPTYLWRGM